MKLLLTSSSITNKSIENALIELAGNPLQEISAVYIPTAANVEQGDKSWLIEDLMDLRKKNFKSIDIADISSEDKNIWLPKLEVADILFFGGGNTYYLMECIRRAGLDTLLPELLEDKVYVGISAGSMVTGKDLALEISKIVYEEDLDRKEEVPGLNYVDFYFLPHLNSEYFVKVREDLIKEAAKKMKEKIYVMDDNSALKIIDNKIEVISEGKWFVIN